MNDNKKPSYLNPDTAISTGLSDIDAQIAVLQAKKIDAQIAALRTQKAVLLGNSSSSSDNEQKQEKDESDKKTSIDHNFNVINDVLTEKKRNIKRNCYSKSIPLARYYDRQLIIRLEAIYNILQIVDERIKKLEKIRVNES